MIAYGKDWLSGFVVPSEPSADPPGALIVDGLVLHPQIVADLYEEGWLVRDGDHYHLSPQVARGKVYA